ncbi:MAG TPA: ribonuclease HII [Candidatus Onthoplasma faecipullorum]|nr:ribonuclease HII [Candidatus Onthoplasma faecipullorum]
MINTKPLFEYDLSLLDATTQSIAGIDEVGRGPLAGPVVTACVIMPYAEMIDGVYDSKKVSKKNREKLYDIILSKAKAVSISIRNQDRIDEINILNATIECMKESVSKLTIKPDILLIDAVKLGICPREMSIIKGDATSYAIACASIVAKVYRDRMMEDYAKVFPYYDFENNVGYGTKKHIEAIKTYGITPIHRLSFLKNIIGEEECKRIHTERVAK